METKSPKILRYVAYTSLVVTAGILFTTLYWLCMPYKTIEFKNEEFKVHTPVVEQGGYLSYTIEYCKDNDLIPEVSTSYIDGIIYQTPNTPQPFYGNDCEPKNFLVYIPKALPAGSYYIQHNYQFKVNPIRTIDIEAKTINFMVLER